MIKLSGKGVVRNLIVVETLEEGFSDMILVGNDYLSDSIIQSNDVDKVEGKPL